MLPLLPFDIQGFSTGGSHSKSGPASVWMDLRWVAKNQKKMFNEHLMLDMSVKFDLLSDQMAKRKYEPLTPQRWVKT